MTPQKIVALEGEEITLRASERLTGFGDFRTCTLCQAVKQIDTNIKDITYSHDSYTNILSSRGMKGVDKNMPLWKLKLTDEEYENLKKDLRLHLYELNNSPIEKRLKLFQGQNDVVKQRDDSFIRQIAVLNMAGQPEKALEYLDGVEFVYREGSSRIRETVIDAQLMLGKKYLTESDFQKALEYFLKAQIPEEEAGSSRFGSRDIQVNYFMVLKVI